MRFHPVWLLLVSLAAPLYVPSTVSAQTLRLYADDMDSVPFANIRYGWDLGTDTPVSMVDCGGLGFQTIGDVLTQSEWDFSCIPPGVPTASTVVPIVQEETCNHDSCGYCPGGVCPGKFLTREDRNFVDPANHLITNAVSEREDRAEDVVIWLRAGAQREGVDGGLGDGESRFCYITDVDDTRTESPLWQFVHQDVQGWYLQQGDSWSSGAFDCEQSIYNEVCSDGGGIFPKIWASGPTGGGCNNHSGTQSGEVLGEGTVRLPSGHRVDTLLVRTVADFCVYAGSACFFKVDEVRTVVYLWVNPEFGTVVRLQSGQNAADLVSWTTIAETDFKYGLFPPLDIWMEPAQTSSSAITITWDPGQVTDQIDRWKVYWGEQSGSGTPYPFDSDTQSAQVTFNGTSATIQGLNSDTDYYFSVTALSSFTDPSSLVATTYESLLFPRQVVSQRGDTYPIEVTERTLIDSGCRPTLEVPDVRVSFPAEGFQICWTDPADPCGEGFRVYGADLSESDAAFQPLAEVMNGTCWPSTPGAPPNNGFFLVTVIGGGDEGPWSHYGR